MDLVLLIFSILLTPVSSGYENIFDIFDEKYILDITELPTSNPENLTPEMNIQGYNDGLAGWIDIVGFKNMSYENGEFFIPDPFEPIIMSDAGILEYGKLVRIELAQTHGYVYDSITKAISFEQADNKIIAKMHLVLKKHSCSTWSCSYFFDTRDVFDEEPIPKTYDKVSNMSIAIVEYNNSVNPHTIIKVNHEPDLFYLNYTYDNESIYHYFKSARVENTTKGVYFANITDIEFWTKDTTQLSQINDGLFIRNTSRPDYANLSITGYNIYSENKIQNITVEHVIFILNGKNNGNIAFKRVDFSIDKTFPPLFQFMFLTVSVLIIIMIIVIKNLRLFK